MFWPKVGNTTNNIINQDLVYRAQGDVISENSTGIIGGFIYDTRFDSDGGIWIDRVTSSSWFRRAGQGLRSNKRYFPALSYILLKTDGILIKDMSDPQLSTWFEISKQNIAANGLIYSNNLKAVAAMNGYIFVLAADVLYIIDLILDVVRIIDNTKAMFREGPGIGYANSGSWENTVIFGPEGSYKLPSTSMSTINVSLSAASVVNPLRGLPAPTLTMMSTNGKLCLVNPDVATEEWETSNWSDASWTYGGFSTVATGGLVLFTAGASSTTQNIYCILPSNKNYRTGSTFGATDADYVINNTGTGPRLDDRDIRGLAVYDSNIVITAASRIYRFGLNLGNLAQSRYAYSSDQDFSGWMINDCSMAWFGGPNKLRDSGPNVLGLTQHGTVPYAAVDTDADLQMAGPFSTANYFTSAYSAPFNFGTGDWMMAFMVASSDGNPITNATLAEISNYTGGGSYSGSGIRVYIDANSRLRCSITNSGWADEDVSGEDDSVKVSINRIHHFIILKYDGKLYVFVNGGIALGVTRVIVNTTLSLTNTSASWTIGKRADNTQAATNAKITAFRMCRQIIPHTPLFSIIAQEELALTRAGSLCMPKGSTGYLMPFYDPVMADTSVFNATHVMNWGGLELLSWSTLAELGISGTLKSVHKVADKMLAITSTKIFSWFGETRFNRAKSDYVDSRGMKHANNFSTVLAVTTDDTPKEGVSIVVKPGTSGFVGVRWFCFGDAITPYKSGSSIVGDYGAGFVGAFISRKLDGTINIMPDYGNTDVNKWTEAKSVASYLSQNGIDAKIKLRSTGWFLQLTGLPSTRLVWKLQIVSSISGLVRMPPSRKITHEPGRSNYSHGKTKGWGGSLDHLAE